MTAFWILLALYVGYLFGWRHAHVTIATECQRLGGFYWGTTVFKCSEVIEPPQDSAEPMERGSFR